MSNKEKIINDLANKAYRDQINWDHLPSILSQAYDAGFKAKKCKEDAENPYHIDYKRQTKINF